MIISVIIATCKRRNQIIQCIESINNCIYKNFELIIINQYQKTAQLLKLYYNFNCKIINTNIINKSRALNKAIYISKGDIIAFTDDDCIVDLNWISNIVETFSNSKNIVGVFGRTFSYNKIFHLNEYCVSTFEGNKAHIINKPIYHAQHIGFGNNMAFRKEIFGKIGGFKEWLGPGTKGMAAEDAEISLRCLIKGYKLLYNPKIVVYHNRWLTKEQFRKQCLSYSCGEMACYGYFGFQGLKLGKKVVINNFKASYWNFRKAIKHILLFKQDGFKLLTNFFEELFFRLRGLMIGWYFAKKEEL